MNDNELKAASKLSFGQFSVKPTSELLNLLCDEDEVTRHAAALALQRRGERVIFERAVELTRDDRPFVRENAAFLLGQLGYPDGRPFRDEAAPILEDLLNGDPSNEVRAAAAYALGNSGAKPALDSLRKAAGNDGAEVRESVAFALCGVETQGLEPLIEELRRDADPEVADWAELAAEIRYGEEFSDESADNLGATLADPDLDIAARRAAAELLAQRDEAIAWKQACAFRQSDVASLRLNAPLIARWLGKGREAPSRLHAVEMLIDLLGNDPDVGVRDTTAEVLAEFKGSDVLAALIAAADDPAGQVRHSVAFALSRHGPPEAEVPLRNLCSDPDERVARYAMERREWMNRTFSSTHEN